MVLDKKIGQEKLKSKTKSEKVKIKGLKLLS